LRKKCPISKVKLWDNSTPWLVTNHSALRKIVDDTRFSKLRTLPNFPEMNPGGKEAAKQRPTFVDMDPPLHTMHRGMVSHVFTKEYTEKLRPQIQKTVDECLQSMIARGSPVDLMSTFAMDVPMHTIYDILGLPKRDMEFLTSCNAVRTNGSSTATQASMASQELLKYLDKIVSEKEKQPGSDLISDLVVNQLQKGKVERDDVVATAFLLLVAGNATVCSMIGLGLVTLLQHPEQLAQLKKDPSLINGAVEELLRFHTASAYAMRRVAKVDVDVEGTVIKAGEGVIVSNQSANRDESVFSNPDKFDIHRSPNPHVAFGYGIHDCVAAPLARAEIQIALNTLIQKLPNLRLTIPLDQVKYTNPAADVGIPELPITW